MTELGFSKDPEGNVILKVTVGTYQTLLVALGMAAGTVADSESNLKEMIELINKLNKGNSNFTPYEVK